MKKGIHRPIWLLCAATPWFAAFGFCRQDDPNAWSGQQWVAWRNLQLERTLSPAKDELNQDVLDRNEVIKSSERAFQVLRPFLDSPKFLSDHLELGNFTKFVQAQHLMALTDSDGFPTHELGMDISDKDYWTYESPMVTPPALLSSQAFLQCMTQPGTYRYAEQMINTQNETLPEDQRWIVYLFRGQFIPSVDRTTYGRMLVVVPNVRLPDGRLWDRWISFAIATPGNDRKTVSKSVSVIATVRDPAVPGHSEAYFADYLRERNQETRDITYQSTFLRRPNPSKNCYNCHKSAVLPIRPKASYVLAETGEMVEAPDSFSSIQARLDKLIERYGRTSIGHLDVDAYGPSLGPVRTDRKDSSIDEATKDLPIPATSYTAIKANMNCAQCHSEIGKLNYLVGVRSDAETKSFASKKGLMQSFIEQGFMPPGNTLTPRERHALWECVSKEYFDPETGKGEFVDWLKAK